MELALARWMVGAWMLAALSGCAAGSGHQNGQREPSLGISHESAATSATGEIDAEAADSQSSLGALAATTVAWEFSGDAGHLITTSHYRLFTTVASPAFLDRLPIFYERALEHYTSALAALPKPREPLEAFVFQTRRQWQAKTEEILPDQADMFSNLGRGGFTAKGTSVLYYIDRWGHPRDTYAIAAHEGWHQYTQRTFKHQLPIWLEEGVATYMEGYQADDDDIPSFDPAFNRERRIALREAMHSNKLIPLQDLLARTPQSFLSSSKDSLLIYYAQVWALTRFLAEGEDGRYRTALSQVLLDAAHGKLIGRMIESSALAPSGRRRGIGATAKVGPAVVREYFNFDLAEFEAQYLAYIQTLAQRSSRRGG